MSAFGKELKIYAESGLRSGEDWLSLGRQVQSGSKPQANITYQGKLIELFTSNQTQPRPRSQRNG